MQGFQICTALCALVSLVAADGGRIAWPKPQEKNVCLNKEDGVFLPVAGSCSKYIICSSGNAIEKDCGNYHFNAKYSACDLPSRAGCVITESLPFPTPSKSVCSGQSDGTKLSVTGSNSKYYLCMKEKAIIQDCGSLKFEASTKQCVSDKQVIVPNPTLPPCYAVANGISLPVPGNSRQYYFCMNNKAFLKDCGNMYFVPEHSACAVLPGNNVVPEVSPTRGPSTPQENNESLACYGKPDGVSLPISGSPRQYYYCINDKAFLKDCGNRMVFVAKYSACALPSDETQEPKVPAPEIEISNTEELIRYTCKNKPFGARLALPNHCSLYVICTYNTGYLKTCGWREFNKGTASCDLPQNVRCKSYEETEEVPDIIPSPKPSTDDFSKGICLNQYDGAFVAAPGSCSDFFFCLKKQGYRKTCGRGRHFNPQNMICVDSKDSRCVDDIFVKKSQRAIDPRDDSSCINRDSGTLLSSPNDCGKFIICDNHLSREMDCPAGLHFNTADGVCDWPAKAKCANKF